MIETTKDTTWHDEKAGVFFVIPSGTQGFILTKSHFYELEDDEKIDLERAKRHYKKNERRGVFAYIERKYRWLNHGSYRKV
jgi:hypothetical protein